MDNNNDHPETEHPPIEQFEIFITRDEIRSALISQCSDAILTLAKDPELTDEQKSANAFELIVHCVNVLHLI